MIVIGVVNVPPTPTAIVAVAVDPTDTITPSSFISITLGGEEIFATTEFPVYPLPELLITNDWIVPAAETTADTPADTTSGDPLITKASNFSDPVKSYSKNSALSTNISSDVVEKSFIILAVG